MHAFFWHLLALLTLRLCFCWPQWADAGRSFYVFKLLKHLTVRRLFKGRCPRVCHRLDFRVAGPVLVATAEETMRSLHCKRSQVAACVSGHVRFSLSTQIWT